MNAPALAAHGLHLVTCTGTPDRPCTAVIAVALTTTGGLCPGHAPRPHIPEPPPYHPPEHAITGLGIHPDKAARCLIRGCPRPHIALGPGTAADIELSYAFHDAVHHHNAWLVGPPGGADGDVCRACGGGAKDKTALEQPRHDLCLRLTGARGWGSNCGCTHDKPHMRGVKPGEDGIDDARTRAARARLAANKATAEARTAPPTVDSYHQFSLIDPDEDQEEDTDAP